MSGPTIAAVIGAALALVAAPPALAAKPIKTVIEGEGFVIPGARDARSLWKSK